MKKFLLATVIFTTAFVSTSKAGEFGNIFGGTEEVEQASREASAQALLALQQIINGIRLRELRQDSGFEDFNAASINLFEATSAMRDILESDFAGFELNENQRDIIFDRIQHTEIYSVFGMEKIVTFRDLFLMFVLLGEDLENRVRENYFTAELFYPQIAQPLQDFLLFGELVSTISEMQLQAGQ